MALLSDILYKAGITEVVGSTAVEISHVTQNSREVIPGSLFVAVKGTRADGHQFIADAIQRGAHAIVCEEFPEEISGEVSFIKVQDSATALVVIAANFYGHPSRKLKLVGVTGTNGKTTTVTLLEQISQNTGHRCGLISTVRYRIANRDFPATHTTPDAVTINKLLDQMVKAGCTHCFMEVSSHAIDQKRVHGLHFDIAVFTNLSHDHLDYHKTFKDYLRAKKRLFDELDAQAYALVNIDDKNGRVMVQNTRATVKTYSLKKDADYRATILESNITGLTLRINNIEVSTRLAGDYNAYNLLAAFAVADLLNLPQDEILRQLSMVKGAEGRFEVVLSETGGISGIVDYAHTPDALKNLLDSVRRMYHGRGKIITVVGCGGNRDKAKRPLMATVAARLSDRVILTSDNPRDEDPDAIINEMKSGLTPNLVKKTLAISDRKEAIRTACALAEPGDIIVVAGKGHEKYQEIKGKRIPFDDKEVLRECFKELVK